MVAYAPNHWPYLPHPLAPQALHPEEAISTLGVELVEGIAKGFGATAAAPDEAPASGPSSEAAAAPDDASAVDAQALVHLLSLQRFAMMAEARGGPHSMRSPSPTLGLVGAGLGSGFSFNTGAPPGVPPAAAATAPHAAAAGSAPASAAPVEGAAGAAPELDQEQPQGQGQGQEQASQPLGKPPRPRALQVSSSSFTSQTSKPGPTAPSVIASAFGQQSSTVAAIAHAFPEPPHSQPGHGHGVGGHTFGWRGGALGSSLAPTFTLQDTLMTPRTPGLAALHTSPSMLRDSLAWGAEGGLGGTGGAGQKRNQHWTDLCFKKGE